MKKCYLSLAMVLIGAASILPGRAFASDTNDFVNISAENQQQRKRITGVVTDQSGETIIGANVSVKGTTTGTITGIDGDFSLEVPTSGILQISYIGYTTQEVPIGSQTTFNITLDEDTQALEEVVVVGYGVQRKSDVTGSVTSVSKDRLGKIPVTNVLQAVQGAAAGVTITQTSSIPGDAPDALVRGRNSINANSGPYIVVDGVPISKSGGTLNDINPNDIESMEILKDASATAIYGTNGANGVILITTKRGSSGKATIRYNGYFGVEDFTNRLKFGDGDQIITRYRDYVSQNPGETLFGNTPVKNEYEVYNYERGITTDWLDAVSQTGILQNHNVSISGGAENVKYYVSADYMDQKGIIKGFNYNRYSVRTNLDVNVTKYLTVGTNTYLVFHNRDGGRANFLMAEVMSPYARMYDDDGDYIIHPMYSETLFTNPLMWTTTNPERRQANININGYAEVDFGNTTEALKGLKYKFNGGYVYMPKRTNSYDGRSVNRQNGYASIQNEETQSYTIENILTYAREIGDHRFDFTGLYASSRRKYQRSRTEAEKFINDDLGWHNIGSAETHKVSSLTNMYSTLSQMARLNYSFDSRYLFTFTVRRDGSSVFGDNNKYGTFPSVALGWNVINENFMEQSKDFLSNLRLRLSYGLAGNEAIDLYQTRVKMDSGMLTMNGASTAALWPNELMGNSDLTWETTKTFNAGIDFGAYNNRITFNLDMYFSRTNDLLLRRSLPKISGYNFVYANMGETANKGIELTMNTRNVSQKDFSWNSTFVLSWNKNEIKDLYGDGLDDLGNRWFIGHPISVIYDYVEVGVWQEDEIAAGLHLDWDPVAEAGDIKLADLNEDGRINNDDRKVLGQTTPKWIGGLTNTFTYKDLSLSVFIQTVQGLKRNNSLIGISGDEMGRRNTTTEIGYWTPENQSNEWRSLRKNSNKHGYGFPRDGSFTRLKDVTLSYNLPQSIINKTGLGALQMYVSGRNLLTFTDWIGWDPESRQIVRGNSSWDSTRGETVYDSSNYPAAKSLVFGVNVTF